MERPSDRYLYRDLALVVPPSTIEAKCVISAASLGGPGSTPVAVIVDIGDQEGSGQLFLGVGCVISSAVNPPPPPRGHTVNPLSTWIHLQQNIVSLYTLGTD